MNYSDILIWKDITNFENYKISNTGIVWNKKYNRKIKHSNEKYPRIHLSNNHGRKHIPIHLVIAQLFIHNPEKKFDIASFISLLCICCTNSSFCCSRSNIIKSFK